MKKTKKAYQVPRTAVAEVDLEGLICQSVRFNVQVNELENKNDPNNPIGEYSGESFYFES